MSWLARHSFNVLVVAIAAFVPSISSLASTATLNAAPDHKAKGKKPYRPKIFKPHEFRTLTMLTEMILRDDEMPGAREAKSSEFIDFNITYDPEIQGRFRDGLRWLDRHSRKLYGRQFVDLKPDQRKDIIQCLEVKAMHRPGEERGREFFELARRYTYMGFYASEEALRKVIPVQEHGLPKRSPRLAGASDEKP